MIVDVDVPLAVIDADEAVTTEVVVDADPGFTVKLADADDVVTVDALTVPEAAMTCPEPAIVGVTDTESTTPPLAITAETVPLNAVEVSETVPV